jgi:hypothetical protein
VTLRTNQELIQIFSWFQGSNDIQTFSVPVGRVDYSLNWTFEHLHLLREGIFDLLMF